LGKVWDELSIEMTIPGERDSKVGMFGLENAWKALVEAGCI
jgi:hypothetical protein